jgi:four helix bundle protein
VTTGVNGEPAVAARPLTPALPPAFRVAWTTREVAMQHPRRTRFDAHDLARDAAVLVLQIICTAPHPLRSLADQTARAVTSVPLNLAEGAGRRGRDRTHHWRIAYGSALEARTALELLVATGSVDAEAGARADALLDRLAAMT